MSIINYKLSVIVPIYNAGKYLQRCVNSIVQQSYTNLEIILVNDGSKDRSLDICNYYKELDKRIIIIDKENAGVSAARKDGLNVATGEFITFVDADDYIDREMYSVLMEALDKESCDIVESGYFLVDENERLIYAQNLNYAINTGKECLKYYLLNKNSEAFLWNKIYRKTLFVGVDFPELRYSEDYLWNVILYSKCKKSITVDKTYYYYYKNMSGACNSNNYKAKMDGIIAGIKSEEYLKQNMPEYCCYSTTYIIDYARFLYMDEYGLKLKDASFHKELCRYYREYFDIHTICKVRSKIKSLGYILFYLTPRLYALMNRWYHKLRDIS